MIAQFADVINHNHVPKLYNDGAQKQCFTHVDNIVRGVITAAEHNFD